jgi:DNA helicase HerA-like ATPase
MILAGHLGSYVAIRQSDIRILALVHKMCEMDRADHKGRYYTARYVSLIPVGEIRKDGAFIRGVRHYPAPGAKVFAVGHDEINAILSTFRKYGFYIGQLAAKNDYHVNLDPRALFGRHFANPGQSGSGKSRTVTSLLQQTLKAMPKSHISFWIRMGSIAGKMSRESGRRLSPKAG